MIFFGRELNFHTKSRLSSVYYCCEAAGLASKGCALVNFWQNVCELLSIREVHQSFDYETHAGTELGAKNWHVSVMVNMRLFVIIINKV